ncbi:putative catechol O-methyltransferase 2 [Cladobotryum mycophilum]|uniref:catechol O-methyltransferase n=1 Tax=Cladobotryum mycophilum TaxID=491253 RepID=A0ABR0SHH2_9HYPO
MSSPNVFDSSKAYAPQEKVYVSDGREIELLNFVYSQSNLNELRGSPEKVLATIDEFARTRRYLMNVGEYKGRIVTDLITEMKPKIMVELGGYIGYSAILFSNAVKHAGGEKYLSLERSPEFAAITSSLIDLAGLGDFAKVIVGSCNDSINRLYAEGQLSRIDLLFLDHHKPAYLPDLKLCEQLGLIQPKCVLAADNVIKPGNPPYLAYVRSSADEKRYPATRGNEGSEFDTKTAHRYKERSEAEAEAADAGIHGDPTLVYESELISSFEPTGIPDGIEITRCIGRVV